MVAVLLSFFIRSYDRPYPKNPLIIDDESKIKRIFAENSPVMKRRKRIYTIAGCLVLLIACYWAYSRWDVWFGNPTEDSYTASDEPDRILLTFGDSDGLSRNVSWVADSILRPSSVELVDLYRNDTVYIKAQGEVYRSEGGQRAYYVARLRDLMPGTRYTYRVRTGGDLSAWHEFSTQKAEADSTQFVYLGDIQDSVGGLAGKFMKDIVRQNSSIDFLVCGGDGIERPMDKYWQEFFSSMDSVAQSVPVLTVTGNHDYRKGVIGTLDRRFSLVYSYFLDSAVGDNQVFTVKYNDMQLFVLDSNRELPYLYEQKRWLEAQLESCFARWKIVVLHHPLYSVKGQMNNIIQRWMFDSIIREQGVDLVLQGHEHAYARMTNKDNDGMPQTPVYVISHFSPKNYRIEFDPMFDKFGSGSRYYQKVVTHGDTLTFTAYDAVSGALYDSLAITKHRAESVVHDFGKDIPESITFVPDPTNKKDMQFAERIREYKQRTNRKQ